MKTWRLIFGCFVQIASRHRLVVGRRGGESAAWQSAGPHFRLHHRHPVQQREERRSLLVRTGQPAVVLQPRSTRGDPQGSHRPRPLRQHGPHRDHPAVPHGAARSRNVSLDTCFGLATSFRTANVLKGKSAHFSVSQALESFLYKLKSIEIEFFTKKQWPCHDKN